MDASRGHVCKRVHAGDLVDPKAGLAAVDIAHVQKEASRKSLTFKLLADRRHSEASSA